jgi:ubiquitin-conjugating enzyme E2 variant
MHTFLTVATVTSWVVACYFIADFATGVLHWAEDTWLAPGRSKLLDRFVVNDNLEHHRRPGTIRNGSYWATNAPSLVIAAGVASILAICGVHDWQPYLVLAFASQGNQVHKWAHMSERPAIVARLQSLGVMQSRRHHGKHHTHPFAVHYCALSDFLNPGLDAIGFWRGLERTILRLGAKLERCGPARGGY